VSDPSPLPALPAYFRPDKSEPLFGFSGEFAYRRLAEGHFRGFKAGRATLIETASVLEYLAKRPLRLTRKGSARAVAA
jgi:hypothetical protein